MADGSQTTEPGKAPLADGLTNEQFDELSLNISKALALSDVLNTMANGNVDAESLHADTLATYSGMLYEILHSVRGIIDDSIQASIASKASA